LTRVKICGITNVRDALNAALAGADAIGLVFAKSSRRVGVTRAREISCALPPFVSRVGVFVDEQKDYVIQLARECHLTALQFHGAEDEEYCSGFSLPVLKAVRVRTAADLKNLERFPASALVLDTYHPSVAGGTGQTFDWSLLQKRPPVPIILAGGLTTENVVRAVSMVKPYAVDVSSGVEKDGKKDIELIRSFIAMVRRCA
jgi:phosphoribosylanthranilate isomerase